MRARYRSTCVRAWDGAEMREAIDIWDVSYIYGETHPHCVRLGRSALRQFIAPYESAFHELFVKSFATTLVLRDSNWLKSFVRSERFWRSFMADSNATSSYLRLSHCACVSAVYTNSIPTCMNQLEYTKCQLEYTKCQMFSGKGGVGLQINMVCGLLEVLQYNNFGMYPYSRMQRILHFTHVDFESVQTVGTQDLQSHWSSFSVDFILWLLPLFTFLHRNGGI